MSFAKLLLWVSKIVAVSVAVAALLVGLIGLWAAGWVGFVNGAIWGALIGLIAGISIAGVLKWSHWGGVSRRAGQARWERWFE
ncbi:MAG TPA: hypothetical protein VK879_12540 [Candidatus Sulfomarinibacteraceae bacterium]|nr:hypothetical protein [Candidatus Sulfomarinibacteraceae bacterium]